MTQRTDGERGKAYRKKLGPFREDAEEEEQEAEDEAEMLGLGLYWLGAFVLGLYGEPLHDA